MDADCAERLASARTNAEACAALDAAKAASNLRKWRSQPLARRYVSEQEMRSLMPGVDLRRLGARGSNADIKNLFFATLAGSTLLYFATALLPGNFGATLQYLSLLVPVALLAVGSVAPGVIGAVASRAARLRPAFKRRLAAHEAGHLVAGYITGVPVRSVNVSGAMDSAVALYDLEQGDNGGGDGVRVGESFLNALAVTSLGGILGEYLSGGSGGGGRGHAPEGGSADLQQLERILATLEPHKRQQHKGLARWAALMAFTVLKNERAAFDAVRRVLETQGASDTKQLAEVIESASTAS